MRYFCFVLDTRLEGAVSEPIELAAGETLAVIQAIEPTVWGTSVITWQWTSREHCHADGSDYWVDDSPTLSDGNRSIERLSLAGKRALRAIVTTANAGSSGRTRIHGTIS